MIRLVRLIIGFGSSILPFGVSLLFRVLELMPLARKQIFNDPPLFWVSFPGEQIFKMGDISPCDEPVHDSPSNALRRREITPDVAAIPPRFVHILPGPRLWRQAGLIGDVLPVF